MTLGGMEARAMLRKRSDQLRVVVSECGVPKKIYPHNQVSIHFDSPFKPYAYGILRLPRLHGFKTQKNKGFLHCRKVLGISVGLHTTTRVRTATLINSAEVFAIQSACVTKSRQQSITRTNK